MFHGTTLQRPLGSDMMLLDSDDGEIWKRRHEGEKCQLDIGLPRRIVSPLAFAFGSCFSSIESQPMRMTPDGKPRHRRSADHLLSFRSRMPFVEPGNQPTESRPQMPAVTKLRPMDSNPIPPSILDCLTALSDRVFGTTLNARAGTPCQARILAAATHVTRIPRS